LEKISIEVEKKFRALRSLLNEKGIFYDEMFSMAKQLVHRDDLILKNEEEIVRLRYDIELSKLEIE